jgi:hypothetical protein
MWIKGKHLAKAGSYNPRTTLVMATGTVAFFKRPLKGTVTDSLFCTTLLLQYLIWA